MSLSSPELGGQREKDWHASATRLRELMDLGHNPFGVRKTKKRAEQSESMSSPLAPTLLSKFMQSNRSENAMFFVEFWNHRNITVSKPCMKLFTPTYRLS